MIELVSEKKIEAIVEDAARWREPKVLKDEDGVRIALRAVARRTARAVLEELGIVRVVEFARDGYCSNCHFSQEGGYICNLKEDAENCPGLIGKSCDEIPVGNAVLVRAKPPAN